ncbi:MAG: HIRAN domain-containing protein [Butyricicoccaceae bacterium]
MLDGIFVTVTGFKHYRDKLPFAIGAELLCCKEPDNPYDTEAIQVLSKGGYQVGYIANGVNTKANGTMSAARIYDRVGHCFLIEVCFSTQSKVICRVTQVDVKDEAVLKLFALDEEGDYDAADDDIIFF